MLEYYKERNYEKKKKSKNHDQTGLLYGGSGIYEKRYSVFVAIAITFEVQNLLRFPVVIFKQLYGLHFSRSTVLPK